jgi:hypothetical protein
MSQQRRLVEVQHRAGHPQRLVETAYRLRVEILDGRILPEVGELQPCDEPFALALDGLAID